MTSRQAIAKHIDVLEKAGLVRSEKRGKYRMLAFNDEPIKTVMNRWLK
ncbi:MAG: helix-turn-helix transcriptional regulator [Gemmatimonadetes bacterium]|nr:helix-turn-helix transcriptional regulator [Gemmatimonadota bacterium]MYK40193.1 helix-turn-helix transcriptional regulator [Gemmatimonadota bacterium]